MVLLVQWLEEIVYLARLYTLDSLPANTIESGKFMK